MPVDHREIAFETAVEDSLLAHGGYRAGDPSGVRPRASPRPRRALHLPARLAAQDLGQARRPPWPADRGHRPRQPARRPRRSRLARRAAPRLQVLRQGAAPRLLRPGPRHEPRNPVPLRVEPPHRHTPAQVQPRQRELDRPSHLPQRPADRHRRAEEPDERPDLARRRLAVQGRPRPRRDDLPLQVAQPGAFRCRSRRGLHDDQARGEGDGLPALQQRRRHRRRQPAKPRRLQDRLPVGAGLGARQPHGHPRALPPPRGRRDASSAARLCAARR